MIAQPRGYAHALRRAFRDLDALLGFLGLTRAQVDGCPDAGSFPLLVPESFARRMRHGDPADPLLRQVLPIAAELLSVSGDLLDPVGDLSRTRSVGVIHKYAGRVLLVATGSCAVHCRYCFRRHFPYADELAAREEWREALALIASDTGIEEVILSGGDPLSLATHKLAQLTRGLAQIPHLRRLRLHTRWPVVLPERVDAELLDWLKGLSWPVTMVLHANHANELDDDVADALAGLRSSGVVLLNQAVLLRGVNDSAEALVQLSRRCGELSVLPYYLHLLDRVQGAAHFDVSERVARRLHRAVRAALPGFLVPRLAREVPGQASKSVLA